PQQDAKPKVLLDFKRAPTLLDELTHVRDFGRERIFVEQPIADIAVIGVDGAQSVAWVRPAQVLLHLPNYTATGDYERRVNVPRQCDAALAVFRFQIAKPGQR